MGCTSPLGWNHGENLDKEEQANVIIFHLLFGDKFIIHTNRARENTAGPVSEFCQCFNNFTPRVCSCHSRPFNTTVSLKIYYEICKILVSVAGPPNKQESMKKTTFAFSSRSIFFLVLTMIFLVPAKLFMVLTMFFLVLTMFFLVFAMFLSVLGMLLLVLAMFFLVLAIFFFVLAIFFLVLDMFFLVLCHDIHGA